MDRWHLPSVEADGKREPKVLFSAPGECRAIVLDLRAGDEMGEHSVRERAVIHVVSGRARIGPPGGVVEAEAGTLVTFAPSERHTVTAVEDTRLLLLLAPWPAAGHFQEGEDADPAHLPSHATAPPL
jgi:quercetin dioxygenase-like cupin family protein